MIDLAIILFCMVSMLITGYWLGRAYGLEDWMIESDRQYEEWKRDKTERMVNEIIERSKQ